MELFDILSFTDNKVQDIDITTTDPDWTDLIDLNADLAQGKYLAMFALQFTLNSTTQSFIYRFSLDGGNTWGPEYMKEVKDKSNTEVIEVYKVIEHTGGNLDIRVQVTREGTADCNVKEGFISIERKQ